MVDTLEFDAAKINAQNEKIVQNQFFTPDNVYVDLSLMKDIPLGCAYADLVITQDDQAAFERLQSQVLEVIKAYQTRRYDTVEPYLGPLGYGDRKIAQLLADHTRHDTIFMMAPGTQFFKTLISHTVRNQNNSRPANKYKKVAIDRSHYRIEPIQVTYHINTFPLVLSQKLLARLGQELGEAFGVNIRLFAKDPALFDQSDWDGWMETIDCFYFNSLGRFTESPFVFTKQGEMGFVGCYFFARKRFEFQPLLNLKPDEFDQEIRVMTARLGMLCDFDWLQNNQVRLTPEAEDVPMDMPSTDVKGGTPS